MGMGRGWVLSVKIFVNKIEIWYEIRYYLFYNKIFVICWEENGRYENGVMINLKCWI